MRLGLWKEPGDSIARLEIRFPETENVSTKRQDSYRHTKITAIVDIDITIARHC